MFFFCRSPSALDFSGLVLVACFGWVKVGVSKLLVFVAMVVLACLGLCRCRMCFPVSCIVEVAVVADLDYFAVVEFHKLEKVWFV